MTALSDFSKFSDGPLVFPINGKNYTLPELSIPLGLTLAGIIDGSDKKASKMKGVELWQLVLGPLWDEMIADGVSLPAVTRAGVAALAEYTDSRELAVVAWETGGDPKALEPYLAGLKTGNRASRRSSSTGGAKKTPTQVSTKAMTSPRASANVTKAKQSGGKTS